MRKLKKLQMAGGVSYHLVAPSGVRKHILKIANEEWDSEDFVQYGEDLQSATWKLQKVKIHDVRIRSELMRSRVFLRELRPRIRNHLRLITAGQSISPLVLRGKDFLIFDDYARLHALRQLGIDECLAWVGRRREAGRRTR